MSDAALLAGASVLVVDDEPANVALLEAILTRAGVRDVRTELRPEAAMDLYVAGNYDLVLLDLHMPGMDGVLLLEGIRRATGDDFVPVVILTADSTPEARQRALAAGANDFLTKPFDRTEVLLRATNLLHTRALHRRVQDHNTSLRAELDRQQAAEAHRRAALEATRARVLDVLRDDGGLQMVFQPIVELVSGAVVGYEALARFAGDPGRGPDVWFAEAADAGLAEELEIAAVRAALRHAGQVPAGAFLSVNVSPGVARSEALADLLSGSASRLVVEVTEHEEVRDYDMLLRAIAPLRRRGVRLAVDDAGAGFSSLQHILKLEPEVIKLDMALVRGIDGDPVKRALASSLVTFAGEIGSTIVAEGIETAGELDTLAALGIAWGQGYFLGRPAPLAEDHPSPSLSTSPARGG